jgi:DHA3 family macrolide efflux protein-like MFS transporter
MPSRPKKGRTNSKLAGSMATAATQRVDWSLLWEQRSFRFFFTAMFVSLFGSGMNFIGVSWYIMSATHSTVAVSWQVIVVTLPGLVVPFLGGVLIDRIDRRYLGVLLDLSRGFAVLAIAYIAWRGNLHLWHLYLMTLITGTGSAMYWANVNALVQEVIPPSQFTGANATVLVGVQTGMLLAGTFVGFIYDHIGIAGILLIDGLTYFVSSYCLLSLRKGYVSPRSHLQYPREFSESTEATAQALESGENPEVAEAGLSLAIYADMKEGFGYLRQQPVVVALGVTHALLMASIVSSNVVLVALANDILHSGARGFGFIEAGWAIGAITGGLITSQLPQRLRLTLYVAAMIGLALGHVAVPFVAFLLGAAILQGCFGFFRALAGIVAQSFLMAIVPRHFMGRTQSAFAIFATILQLAMSFSLGWLAERFSIAIGFFLLAFMYAAATLTAFRARRLLRSSAA